MPLDHRVAEEEAAALDGLTEDVELVGRHRRDGRAAGRVEAAERGRHLRGHAEHVRRTFAAACTRRGCQELTISPYLARSPWCMALSAASRSAGESK